MTVAGIIEQYNTERPNSVDDGQKLSLLKRIEQDIIDTVIMTHKGAPSEEELLMHMLDFDMDTELLVSEPYDDLYIYFLDQRISFNNNDTKRYNQTVQLFNNAMLTYQQMYNRSHMALKDKSHLIKHEVL